MALRPRNAAHKKQIAAGTEGRKRGHSMEEIITTEINKHDPNRFRKSTLAGRHVFNGTPADLLLDYVLARLPFRPHGWKAHWLGGLATSGVGDVLLADDGTQIKKSKSDVVIRFSDNKGRAHDVGISIKTCSKNTPTNAQLFFTTASAFCGLLRGNGIAVSVAAERGLRMFCGDPGYRPLDMLGKEQLFSRKSDTNRWFWEELPRTSLNDLEKILGGSQDKIADILLRRAYRDDPFPPEFILHQTKLCPTPMNCEVAIYAVDELIALSRRYNTFYCKPYFIRKGTFKGDPNEHAAPRCGIIQMQRGGQKQHPTQLQFNLKAGYFYDLETL